MKHPDTQKALLTLTVNNENMDQQRKHTDVVRLKAY